VLCTAAAEVAFPVLLHGESVAPYFIVSSNPCQSSSWTGAIDMSLATRARRQKLGVRQARTSNSANLWNLKSPLADRAVTLSGDMRMLLFYQCEGDPAVLSAQYAGAALDLSDTGTEAVADALVVLQDGSTQARVLDDGSTRALVNITALRNSCGCSAISVSAGDLLATSLRIRNWRAAIAAYDRCADMDLTSIVGEVETYVRLRATTSIGALVRDLNTHHPSLVLGAAIYALRRRLITSNMDSAPWCMHTRLARLPNGDRH